MPIEQDIVAHMTARGMLLLASKDFLSIIASVVFFMFLARYLPSVEDLGILTGLQTIILMFVIFSGMGVPLAATRFISAYLGSNEKEKAQSIYPLTFSLCIILSAVFSIILYLISPQVSDILFHNSANVHLIQLTSLDIFIYSMMTTCIFLLSATMEFKKVTIISILNSCVKFSASIVLFILGFQFYGIILGFVLGDTLALIAFIYVLRYKILRWNLNVLSISEIRGLIKYALSVYGFQIITFLSFRIDIYLLMAMSTLYLVGIYAPASFIATAFLILLVAMDQALLPITSRIYGESGISSFKYTSRYISRYLFLFYFPMGFALASSAPSLVTISIGERFSESVYPIVIIVVSLTLTSPGVVVTNLLRSAGYNGVILKSAAAGLLVQVIIAIITIPLFGVLGASAARFVSRFVTFAYPVYKLNKIGGLGIDIQALKHGLGSSVLVSSIIISVNLLISESYSLILQYVAAFISYLIFIRITHALHKKDVELIDRTFLGKMRWLTGPFSKMVID